MTDGALGSEVFHVSGPIFALHIERNAHISFQGNFVDQRNSRFGVVCAVNRIHLPIFTGIIDLYISGLALLASFDVSNRTANKY